MIIRGLKVKLITNDGNYGFSELFSRNLTVIRAGNSGGKSTLVSCILFALGMEELLGGKGESVLPYCLSTYFEYEKQKIEVIASEVYLEIENKDGEVKTIRRAIKDNLKSTKLIELYDSKYITNEESLKRPIPTFIHDSGGAKREEGFHFFLEKFLNLDLPEVGTTSGSIAKLYFQTIFAAHAIEQKRGWTDYLANIPFYGIRDPKTRVVEFLLGLDVFEINTLKSQLVIELNAINETWYQINKNLNQRASDLGLSVAGINKQPSALLNLDELNIFKESLDINEYISILKNQHEELVKKENNENNVSSDEILENIEDMSENLQFLTIQFEQLNSNILSNRVSVSSYQDMLKTVKSDLDKNKAVLKLRDLGANFHLKVAEDKCPTCFQNIVDNLLAEEIKGPQMDLKAQIEYLKSQKRMLEKQIEGITKENTELAIIVNNTKREISKNHHNIGNLRKSILSGTELEKLYIRQQVYIENEVRDLANFKDLFSVNKEELRILRESFLILSQKLENLPKETYTKQDLNKIKLFEDYFRENTDKFHYESAPISSIFMSKDNLLPSLAHMELREIRKSNTKTDSSASDFVRLIWSYIIALFQASNISPRGNHLNFLLLDEPGQHSMAQQSQRALLSELSQNRSLQSIVAASFDESEAIFHEVTHGIAFKLICWEGKLIKPL